MSDVSKTNELIEQLRDLSERLNYHSTGPRDTDITDRAADALEAATRVPVQGEPNDAVKAVIDRDVAIDAIAGGTISVPGGYGVLHGDDAANIVDAIIGHASVPDAATEKRSSAKIADLVYENAKLKAERDAATDALERVKVILDRDDFGDDWEHDEWVYRQAAEKKLEEIEAALDGEPEPEAVELPETGLEVRDSDGDLISSGEHRRVLHQGGYVCDTCVNILGINVRWDRAGFMEGHPFPVEGEN